MRENNPIVLIVDDDTAIQNMLYKVIKSNGLEADIASNGEEALRMIEKKNYDLMLQDINMPGIDGFEVISRLRSKKITLPYMD